MKRFFLALLTSSLVFSFHSNLHSQEGDSDTIISGESPESLSEVSFKIVPGTFTDSRDGKTYKTIRLGEQTWMAENLNYKSRIGSWAYQNNSEISNTYGRLYNWSAALSACPEGWRLPGDSDWDRLIEFLGGENEAGTKMKDKGNNHWKSLDAPGNNQSGFSALPAGYRGINSNYLDLGILTFFWSSSEENQFYAWSRGLYVNYTGIYRNLSNKNFASSVRCIKE